MVQLEKPSGNGGQLPHSLGCWEEKALLRSSSSGDPQQTQIALEVGGSLQALVGQEAYLHSTGMRDPGHMPKVTHR